MAASNKLDVSTALDSGRIQGSGRGLGAIECQAANLCCPRLLSNQKKLRQAFAVKDSVREKLLFEETDEAIPKSAFK